MNNANFGYDCRDNPNNAKFQPIIDEVNEITYIKKYNLLDDRISKFVNSNVLEHQINQQFEQNISTVKLDDPYKTVYIKTFESQKNEELDALKCLKEKKKTTTTKHFDSQVEDVVENKKIKTMIEFDNDCNSIKSIIVSENTTVDISTICINGKMLMFAKVLLKSFVYDIIDVFSFPYEEIRAVYNQYDIEKCFLYLNVTDIVMFRL